MMEEHRAAMAALLSQKEILLFLWGFPEKEQVLLPSLRFGCFGLKEMIRSAN
jgi:hypothetical protein